MRAAERRHGDLARRAATAGVKLSYHWLDDRGNAIVWDGPRVDFGGPVAPGDEVEVALRVRAPQPPGRYRLAFDLVEELRFWFAEVGSSPLELDVEVLPRIEERRLAVVVRGGADAETTAALAAQEEPLVEADAVATAYLVAGRDPGSRLVAADPRRPRRGLRRGRRLDRGARPLPAALGARRRPQSRRSRTRCCSRRSSTGLEPGEHEGLPAYVPDGEPAIFDGRIRLRLPRGRRRALKTSAPSASETTVATAR